MRADGEIAAAAQAKLDAAGALERGRAEGAAQAQESYEKSFDEVVPIIRDDAFTLAWKMAMDLLFVAPEDPRRTNFPLPSQQQDDEETEEGTQDPEAEAAALQTPPVAEDTPTIPTATPTVADLIKAKQEIGAELAAGTASGTPAPSDPTVVNVE